MATHTLIAAEQFDALPNEEGHKLELLDGELIEMSSANATHNSIWRRSSLLCCPSSERAMGGVARHRIRLRRAPLSARYRAGACGEIVSGRQAPSTSAGESRCCCEIAALSEIQYLDHGLEHALQEVLGYLSGSKPHVRTRSPGHPRVARNRHAGVPRLTRLVDGAGESLRVIGSFYLAPPIRSPQQLAFSLQIQYIPWQLACVITIDRGRENMNPQAGTDMKTTTQARPPVEYNASVYCPMCTHTVQATVVAHGKSVGVKPGRKCPRCSSSLDAGYVFRLDRAA